MRLLRLRQPDEISLLAVSLRSRESGEVIGCTVNTCGTPATGYINVSVTLCGKSLLISPNPVSDNIQVNMITEDETNVVARHVDC
jgi:hypothetical protein